MSSGQIILLSLASTKNFVSAVVHGEQIMQFFGHGYSRFKSGIYYFDINMWKAKEEKSSSINICHINAQNSTEKAELKLKFYHENKIWKKAQWKHELNSPSKTLDMLRLQLHLAYYELFWPNFNNNNNNILIK